VAKKSCDTLHLILGDQLDRDAPSVHALNKVTDVLLMVEAREESTHVWSSKPRTVMFLSAMRHHAQWLRQNNFRVEYRALGEHDDASLADGLSAAIESLKPKKIVGIEPGDLRVRASIDRCCKNAKTPLSWHEDSHFLCSVKDFVKWGGKNKTLRLEYFYREMRRRHNVLMQGDEPEGGQWNYDAENRKSFGKNGPVGIAPPLQFAPSATTNEVIALVEKMFPEHPGLCAHFGWPVTREDALKALAHFIECRLPTFGAHQDAMWADAPWLSHSLISAALNLKLLNPLEVVKAAEQAYVDRHVDLASAEGFVRQVLGWREFMRGVYFLDMPALKTANHFQHERQLPKWYWTGKTKMRCMSQAIGQTLDHGYAHHIQRLMVTGLFGTLAEILPQAVCDWYLAVYIDAVEWVELPNTAGMALFANGGRFTSKPYVASGAYIKRMSNYCDGCAYKPDQKTGTRACPMTTLYWNFLDKHEAALMKNPRTSLMAKNITRMSDEDRAAIRSEAKRMLNALEAL
jgi:deoxyribodipyrimidine photolyase-related protein